MPDGSGMDSPSRHEVIPPSGEQVDGAPSPEFVEMIEAMTVAQITAGVEHDELDAAEVVEAEKLGKNRKTVLDLAPKDEDDPEAEEA